MARVAVCSVSLFTLGLTLSCALPEMQMAKGVCKREQEGGPVKCCLSGETLVDGNYSAWRCALGAYEQAEADGISPFVGGKSLGSTLKITGGKGRFDVLFADVSCPPSDWGTCTAPTKSPLALQVQLSGNATDATRVGAFKDFCITSIEPIE